MATCLRSRRFERQPVNISPDALQETRSLPRGAGSRAAIAIDNLPLDGRALNGTSGGTDCCRRRRTITGKKKQLGAEASHPLPTEPAPAPAPLRRQDAGRRLLPGQSGARQDALPLPRWQIDRPEDPSWSCTYRRGPASAVARLSREASSEWPEMRAKLDRKVEVAAEKRRYIMESVSDDVTPAAWHRKRSHDDRDRC